MISDVHSSLMFLLGGMALFRFGMGLASDNLQKLSANRVRTLLSKLSERRLLAVLVGIILTALLQSSGAVTSMLVGLGTAKVISLQQVMGVILGTAVGTTLTVQLISFDIDQYGLGIFFFSFLVYLTQQKRVVRNVAAVIMGFGLLFFGLELMGLGTQVFKTNPVLIEQITHLTENPLLAIAVVALFTTVTQSSAAIIGLAMSLASAQIITVMDAIYWVYGANIGTTSTALISSVGSNYIGRQVAWSHFFYKVGSVVLFYFFSNGFVSWISEMSTDSSRSIANLHTAFNVISALVFLPFINMAAGWMQSLIQKTPAEEEFTTQYLKNESYDTPALALAHAQREILRMGDIVLSMVRDSLDLLKGDDPDLMESIRERDNQVDLLNREIKLFLVNYEGDHRGLARNVLQMIDFCSDLESAADVVDKGIVELARKKQALKLEFSPQGWAEICAFHQLVIEIATMSLSAAQLQDVSLAQQVIDKKRHLKQLEKDMRESHLTRLGQGLRESLNTSSIHLDLLSDWRHIVGLMANHAYSYK